MYFLFLETYFFKIPKNLIALAFFFAEADTKTQICLGILNAAIKEDHEHTAAFNCYKYGVHISCLINR